MFHTYRNPDIPPGSGDGLFLSDCIDARTTAMENLAVFDLDTGSNSCILSTGLGNSLILIQPVELAEA